MSREECGTLLVTWFRCFFVIMKRLNKTVNNLNQGNRNPDRRSELGYPECNLFDGKQKETAAYPVYLDHESLIIHTLFLLPCFDRSCSRKEFAGATEKELKFKTVSETGCSVLYHITRKLQNVAFSLHFLSNFCNHIYTCPLKKCIHTLVVNNT
jgi:hypothetical protein